MYLDILNYQKFYNSSIGKFLSSHIQDQLKKYCFLYDNQNIGCFGYSEPYLNFLKKFSISSTYCFSKRMGILDDSIMKGNKVLIDEEKIPFQDSFFDHIFLIHYLENNYNTKASLREIWRSLAPEGKLYIIVPNKKSSWYLSDKSPFSSGNGFSKKQISELLEDSFFDIQNIDRLVYFPNTTMKFINNNNALIDKFGSFFFKYFNGVYFCVVKKRIYANVNTKSLVKQSLIGKVIKKI